MAGRACDWTRRVAAHHTRRMEDDLSDEERDDIVARTFAPWLVVELGPGQRISRVVGGFTDHDDAVMWCEKQGRRTSMTRVGVRTHQPSFRVVRMTPRKGDGFLTDLPDD